MIERRPFNQLPQPIMAGSRPSTTFPSANSRTLPEWVGVRRGYGTMTRSPPTRAFRLAPTPTIAELNEAIRLDLKIDRAFANRGSAYLQKGDYDRAIADESEAIRVDPRNAGASTTVALDTSTKAITTALSPTSTRRFGSIRKKQVPATS
jgi:hypothetical protein